MIGRSLNADLRKMKGTSVILAHLLIPIITSVIFLIYYFFSPWNENMKVIAFYQAIGAGLPNRNKMQVIFKICCLYRINLQHFYRNC